MLRTSFEIFNSRIGLLAFSPVTSWVFDPLAYVDVSSENDFAFLIDCWLRSIDVLDRLRR